jgi:hypothetical protein
VRRRRVATVSLRAPIVRIPDMMRDVVVNNCRGVARLVG